MAAVTMSHIETSFDSTNTNGNGNGNLLPLSADARRESDGSSESKSPLATFGLFKGLSSEKKLKADGQPPKRRGPKPDSKPALTRRQELNRQAQRTHRERKELYIKALEQEVLRLKESYGEIVRERDAVVEDNKKLRELLAANEITCPDNLLSPPARSNDGLSLVGNPGDSSHFEMTPQSQLNPSQSPDEMAVDTLIDYTQIGIDFVLALEKPCFDHIQMLCTRSQSSDGTISGHAMMATCPPASHMMEHPDVQYPHKMPDMTKGELMKLLDLSNALPLDTTEITPVMAWSYLLKSPRFKVLTEKDFVDLKTELEKKIRCYGFGAVLERFEVEDALVHVLASRTDCKHGTIPASATAELHTIHATTSHNLSEMQTMSATTSHNISELQPISAATSNSLSDLQPISATTSHNNLSEPQLVSATPSQNFVDMQTISATTSHESAEGQSFLNMD